MTAEERGTRGRSASHLLLVLLVAALAVAGVLAVVVRPLAPGSPPIETALARFPEAVVDLAARYRTPRYVSGSLQLLVTLAVPLLAVGTSSGRRLVRRLAGDRPAALWRSVMVAVVIVAVTALAVFPFRLWTDYLHERAWGFRTAGLGSWLVDQGVGAAVGLVTTAVAALAFAWLVRRSPDRWHLWLVPIGTGLTAVAVVLHPLLVQPLLLDTAPLPPGEVRTAVEEVLERAGEGELEILVGDASRRTTKVNAFVTGLGPSRQVVLYDTLLELPVDQVAVVVAHELAHREHRDIARGVLLSAAGLAVLAYALRATVRSRRVHALVDARAPSDPRLMAAVVAVVVAGQVLALPAVGWASRRAEAAADHRAMELSGQPDELVRTARQFVLRDLAEPRPPGWVNLLWGSHPTVEERIRRAVAFAERHELPLPSPAELLISEADLVDELEGRP